MKKNIILLLVIGHALYSHSFAQDIRNDVQTPLRSNVVAYETVEFLSLSERRAADRFYNTIYPNAIKIPTYGYYSATRRFEGDGLDYPRWIGYETGNTDEAIYWEDGSYIEVPNEVYLGKVSWASGDHSAITTPIPGRYISKWAYFPLYEHEWDDSPFGTTNLKYYKLCFEKIENETINSDYTKNACKFLMKNISVQGETEINITVGDWIKIEGTFNAPTGMVLNISPE